jgi:flagellar biosynthesis/type III secretory pathway protein FliH
LSADILVKAARFPSFQATDGPEAPFRAPVVAKANEAELARETARREGLALGEAEGRAAALADWVPRLTALAAALEQTLTVVRAERERLAAEITETMPQVAIELARKVVERELATGDDVVRAAIEPVARRLAESGGAAVRLAPDVAAALEAWRAEDEHAATLPSVVIRVDEGLHRVDWIIETEGGLLDGRLVTKFEEAARILTEPEA